MATGIDAAGLALAIFPVVISTVDWYSGRISGRDFKHLSESLKTNEKIFLNSIELLLRCIAPPREVKDFLDNLKGPQWKSESLEKKVREHLGDEAESILDKMKDIYRTINKLGDKLPARDKAASNPKIDRVKVVVKSFVHGTQYNASLERLRISIDEFRKLTKDAVKLAPSRGFLPQALNDLSYLSVVQECADGLYHAVQAGWQCQCTEPHPANIKLDVWCVPGEATGNVHLKFALLFADDARLASPDHWMTAEITQDHQNSVANLIKDLCTLLKEIEHRPRPARGRHGSISAGSEGLSYELSSKSDQPLTPPMRSSVNLADFFNQQNNMRLTTKNKVQLALMLAWGVLQISSTSWLSGTWTKDNILLVMDTPDKPVPYVSHRFESSRRLRRASTLSPTVSYRIASWVKNASLFALGVFLLEVCYNRSIEDLANPDEKNTDGEPLPHTTLLTAMRLSNSVQDEMGLNYAQAVNACLQTPEDLGGRGNANDPSLFAKSMLKHIIDPLTTVADSFPK